MFTRFINHLSMHLTTWLMRINSGIRPTVVVVYNPKFKVLIRYSKTQTTRIILIKDIYLIIHPSNSMVLANPSNP